jgi:ribonuclease HI
MIKIQKITKEQIDTVASLLEEEWLLHADNTRSYSRPKIKKRNIAEWLDERVFAVSDFICFVAIETDVVGFILCRVQKNIRIAQDDTSLKVEDVYVAPDARGKGVARALLSKAETFAAEKNIKEILGDVYQFNDASKSLFTTSGYTPEYTSYMKLLDGNALGLQQPSSFVIKKAKLYCDGGSRGNPGPSAGGYVILDMENNVVKSNGKYLGITTNNQAEYHSLKGGLEMALELEARELDVYMDSMLVVNQMKGIFKIKNRELWPIHDAITKLLPGFQSITFTHIPRELNSLADSVVNETLDAMLK